MVYMNRHNDSMAATDLLAENFTITADRDGEIYLCCASLSCHWDTTVRYHTSITELAAVARQHIGEAHPGDREERQP